MNFGDALQEIKQGAGFSRQSWKDVDRYVTMEEDELVFIRPMSAFIGEPKMIPWNPKTDDILAEDWIKVKEGESPNVEQEESGPSNG